MMVNEGLGLSGLVEAQVSVLTGLQVIIAEKRRAIEFLTAAGTPEALSGLVQGLEATLGEEDVQKKGKLIGLYGQGMSRGLSKEDQLGISESVLQVVSNNIDRVDVHQFSGLLVLLQNLVGRDQEKFGAMKQRLRRAHPHLDVGKMQILNSRLVNG